MPLGTIKAVLLRGSITQYLECGQSLCLTPRLLRPSLLTPPGFCGHWRHLKLFCANFRRDSKIFGRFGKIFHISCLWSRWLGGKTRAIEFKSGQEIELIAIKMNNMLSTAPTQTNGHSGE